MPGSPEPTPPGYLTACPLAPTDDDLPPGLEEIPPEFGWDGPDPDCSRPPELAGLSSAELDALPFTTPAPYREPSWPIDLTTPFTPTTPGQPPAAQPASPAVPGQPPAAAQPASPAAAGACGPPSATGPAGVARLVLAWLGTSGVVGQWR